MLFLHSSGGLYGADRQLLLLAGGLDPERYRALVVLAAEGELAGELRRVGVEVQVRRLAVIRRELVSARGLAGLARAWASDTRALARLARERGVAIVHSNTSVTLGGAPAAARARVPHVWHVREIYEGRSRLWPLHRRLLRTAAALPCVSRAARLPLGTGVGLVVPDGVALEVAPASEAQRQAAREALGVGPDQFACAVVGRVSDWKGQDVLVRALAEARRGGGGSPLAGAVALVAGEPWGGVGERRQELLALALELGVGERVRWLGFRGDVASVYAAADVVAVPSVRPDPLPNAALEAAAAGCCVVASEIGGLPEILTDGRTGVLVAPGDAGALAEALGELAGDPGRRERLGRAAARDVRERFAPTRLLERVQALYDELLG